VLLWFDDPKAANETFELVEQSIATRYRMSGSVSFGNAPDEGVMSTKEQDVKAMCV
jgi:hypothetical protein